MKVGYQVSETNETVSSPGTPVRIFGFNVVTSGIGPSDLLVYDGVDGNGTLILTLTVPIEGGVLFVFENGITFKSGCALSYGGDIQVITSLFTKI